MADDRYDAGMRVRREVLGDEHVDRATAAITPLEARLERGERPSGGGRGDDAGRR